MKVEVWAIGKTTEAYLQTGLSLYEKRLSHYLPFTWQTLPAHKGKNNDPQNLKQQEGQTVLEKLRPDDYLVLLDERGQQLTSLELAQWLQQRLQAPARRLIFLIGGAYGFSPDLYARANAQLALSRLTFSHQMARLFLMEQLYRAMTILRNEPYHNE
ncbi:MAG: 23S rRNA (pseudouridine(1915)-N(3))-methyltransferase RlmH [Saprospiraceae bacterium]|nr:23S rRNA (pseudouridine(1915)-N(3))-methyltransferase RlmH [Saprospiraceae bacterium]MDW8230607.1 23S rRNA (pseudouridine(1915)-N(3))-methyltransferase RlmH [Saprospiraceae bacterium]